MANSFDIIIIGAGSAGCVLASRLTEDPRRRVLLLEAGNRDSKVEMRIPAAFSKLFKTGSDWAYFTDPEPHLGGRRLYIPRGKTVGGSSSMNAMIYIRGNRRDYEDWGNGWSWNEVFPHFLRSENQHRGLSRDHATGGPLDVADLRTINPLSRAFVAAANQIGIPFNDDFNGPQQDGAGFYQVTQRGGVRCSAATAFLRTALSRRNLRVETGAHATRILFEGRRARGVEYLQGGHLVRAEAGGEIILSGGAINSPQLLELSGVGAADHLRSLGIGVVADLPGVGANLQDHPVVPVAYSSLKAVSLATAESLRNVLAYLTGKRGPLTSNVAEAGGFVRTREDLSAPDLQFHFAPVFFLEHGFVKPAGHGFTIGPTLIAPTSLGQVRIRSTDPLAAPSILGNCLGEKAEMDALVEGVRLGRRIAATTAFEEFRGEELEPGRGVEGAEEIRDFIRRKVELLYHPVGTCRMGEDAGAVVDHELRVRGVEALRVADASIMPRIPRGNTNAPTIMIGEKAAVMIGAGSVSFRASSEESGWGPNAVTTIPNRI